MKIVRYLDKDELAKLQRELGDKGLDAEMPQDLVFLKRVPTFRTTTYPYRVELTIEAVVTVPLYKRMMDKIRRVISALKREMFR